MYKNDETPSINDSEKELDPGIQALADMADKMGDIGQEWQTIPKEEEPSPAHNRVLRYNEALGVSTDNRGFDANGVYQRGGSSTNFYHDYKSPVRYGLGKAGIRGGRYDIFGFDVNGHNKYTNSGLDLRGFDMNGVFVKTGQRVDERGFNQKGYFRGKVPGRSNRDMPWFDQDGIDCHGFRRGYKYYGISDSRLHGTNVRTGTRYDEDGYDAYGFNVDGYNRDGFDFYGFDRDGYNLHGFNRAGFDREGFDETGLDKEGYNREGLDRNGYTREFNAKFNKYGLDENGYMKNGKIDPDVEFAISFAESGIKDQNKYATENSLSEKEVRDRIKLARKKCQNIDVIINSILLTGNKMRVAAIANDCNKFLDGELGIYEFWDKHPRLNISELLSNFIDNPDKRKQLSDKTIENLVLSSEKIEDNLQIFGASWYDVPAALRGIEDFKKIYTRFGTDGSPEQIQKKRENTKKIFDTIKYFYKYKNNNLGSLLGFRQSFDGGQTWIEYTGEAIGEAMDALKNSQKLVCVQTVIDYLVNKNRGLNP